ncbi:MAG: QacE family quaternary ammonium compound efflux SMR transporter [Candidatus Pelagibacter sp. TMED253]|jgi:small multidrug resistance pump|nr:SMR family transporter [Candidatus Pelagibacter sp.]RPG95407.1 MAG: QacE family quaternary ammonium compound efflux SMR transporter [Candidatus Pelagibacter sp. TMED253]|tara:strand:- start:292 stop:624 length:333 start_codon:yes stop_codon:yes gene_type:complete
MTLTQAYILLGVAIAGEIIATGSLKATDGFTKWTPSLISILAISICMFTMSHVVKILPIGITYATWSGVGIVALSLIGIFKYKQIPNLATIIGLFFIIIGVIIVNTMNNN